MVRKFLSLSHSFKCVSILANRFFLISPTKELLSFTAPCPQDAIWQFFEGVAGK
jgi:hypothetical protein